MSSEDIKRIDVKEFRERGYLQEVNRCFLHPLGMALEVQVNEDGTEQLGGIWDYRDDPEGMRYEDIDLKPKAELVEADWNEKLKNRMEVLGYMVQPFDEESIETNSLKKTMYFVADGAYGDPPGSFTVDGAVMAMFGSPESAIAFKNDDLSLTICKVEYDQVMGSLHCEEFVS